MCLLQLCQLVLNSNKFILAVLFDNQWGNREIAKHTTIY